ncbi:hypothetical protein [Candidatus Endomicrobiellum agilis]|uniref:hypothetical protein n=1 Tax=Candidatus Endomicrobiellum agilis TaxID=3238957 RepID=UPI00358A4960|nr:hypothetical protein [Endomicrobium sp.]
MNRDELRMRNVILALCLLILVPLILAAQLGFCIAFLETTLGINIMDKCENDHKDIAGVCLARGKKGVRF